MSDPVVRLVASFPATQFEAAYEIRYVVRPALAHERLVGEGPAEQWIVYVDGGVLGNGEESELFETLPDAVAFASRELATVMGELL